MKNKCLLLLLGILLLTGCSSEFEEGLYTKLDTTKGEMVLKLAYDKTPVTVANFITLAEGTNEFVTLKKGTKYYDNTIFHRVIKDFMIQGGDPSGTGAGSPGYKFENEPVDSLTHNKKGILSMANAGPNTNGSQFFITHKPTPHLDGGYTVFGELIKGFDVLDTIANLPVSKEQDKMNKPLEDVVINSVTIIRVGRDAKKFDAPKIFKDYFDDKKKRDEEKNNKINKLKENFVQENDSFDGQSMTLKSDLVINFYKKGNGKKPNEKDFVGVYYAGYFKDGGLFDSNILEVAKKYQVFDKNRLDKGGYEPMKVPYSKEAGLINGFKFALLEMSVGDKIRVFIPAKEAYGEKGSGGVVPPNADLCFDMELVNIFE